jgi:transcriptional regulator with XRE-family HTH domain
MATPHSGLLSIPLSEQQCQRLRARRNALGLTQHVLAERVGCSKRTILRLENAQWAVSPELLSSICNVLGMKWNINIKVTLQPGKKAKRSKPTRRAATRQKLKRA